MPIKHVVIIFQENRSFNNLFAGYPGALTAMSGKTSTGASVLLKPVGLVSSDICHGFWDGINDYDHGAMDHFDQNCTSASGDTTFPYSYVARNLTKPYWAMAQQYTLADHMFATMWGPSYTAHLTIIAGTADLKPSMTEVDYPSNSPWGCDAPPGTVTSKVDSNMNEYTGPFPCYKQIHTMADTLDAARVSWRYYAPQISYGGGGSLWTGFDNIYRVRYGADWNNIVSPSPRILNDVPGGNLAGVTWVIPDWPYSDHAGGGNQGPSWVASVVNAIGESKYWDSTAIVVMWDDWGGWYDDAAPPQLDFRGNGLRVPCIIISPYARRGYVSHTQYEFGSVLKFVEQVFDLPALGTTADGYTDTRATSIMDAFDFTQTPLTFKPIPARFPPSTFLEMRPSLKAPDDE